MTRLAEVKAHAAPCGTAYQQEKRLEGNTRVGPTALFTAQAWRAGGFENAALFDHPLGRLMYTASSFSQRFLRPLLPGYVKDFHRYLVLRHRAIEARMERLLPDVVIEVAAGLSPRGLTYARRWPEIRYVELDLPPMVRAKKARLRGTKLPPNYRLASADILAQDFADSLPVTPGRDQRVVVITEGLMDYLAPAEKQRAWDNLAGLMRDCAPGSRYLLECWPRTLALPGTASSQLGLQGMSLLVGRSLGENLHADAQAAIEALHAGGFASVVRQDLHSLAKGLGVSDKHCPFLILECAVE